MVQDQPQPRLHRKTEPQRQELQRSITEPTDLVSPRAFRVFTLYSLPPNPFFPHFSHPTPLTSLHHHHPFSPSLSLSFYPDLTESTREEDDDDITAVATQVNSE
jgi:hypothetical protein